MIKIFPILLLASLYITNAYADDTGGVSGYELQEFCREPTTHSICLGYLAGVRELSIEMFQLGKMPETICFPAGTTNKQTIIIVIEYLNDNPRFLHMSAARLVMIALENAYPCK